MGAGFLDLAAARDISPGGVGVIVSHRFEGCRIHEDVDLLISLPGEPPFLVRGHIRHRTKTHEDFFGVEFRQISRVDRQRIAQYMKGQDPSE